MRRIAARLSNQDVTAVAAWLAAQAIHLPIRRRNRSNLVRMPLACGSQR